MKRSYSLTICLMLISVYTISAPSGFNPLTYGPAGEEIRSNLYVRQSNGAPVLLDGDLTQYDPSYSNAVDGKDARKMNNFSENIGMIRGTVTLVIERRQTIDLTDTIFYKLWQLHQRPYQLEFITSNMNHPGLEGFLEDSYLNTFTSIDLNGTTKADFSVTADPASASASRFRIIFKAEAAKALPLTFTSAKAYHENKTIRIDWKTENEINTNGYTIEKSLDGDRFTNATNINANNLAINNYTWVDEYPANGFNYYRIMNKAINGEVKYSEVLKVLNSKSYARINVYPNPVTNNTINLLIEDQPAGEYEIRMINNFGQPVFISKIKHTGGDIIQTLRPNQTMLKGVYQLEVNMPGIQKITGKIIY